MSKPKRQHWVPQFYLKYFAVPETQVTKNPLIYVHSRDGLGVKCHRRSIKDVCVQNYLYSPDQPNGERDWSMEYMLGDIETQLGSLWPEITQGGTALQSDETKRLMATFVAAMHLRNPAIHQLIGSTLALADQLFGPVGTRVVDKPEKVHPDAGNADRFFVSMIRERLPETTKIFQAKNWTIGVRDSDSFITSDLPVVFWNPSGPKKAGLGVPGTTTFFPLSPRRILLMGGLPTPSRYAQVQLDNDAVRTINSLLVASSKRFVFATHQRVTGLTPAECQPDDERLA